MALSRMRAADRNADVKTERTEETEETEIGLLRGVRQGGGLPQTPVRQR